MLRFRSRLSPNASCAHGKLREGEWIMGTYSRLDIRSAAWSEEAVTGVSPGSSLPGSALSLCFLDTLMWAAGPMQILQPCCFCFLSLINMDWNFWTMRQKQTSSLSFGCHIFCPRNQENNEDILVPIHIFQKTGKDLKKVELLCVAGECVWNVHWKLFVWLR